MRKFGLPAALLAFAACSDIPTRPSVERLAAPDRATSFSRGTTGVPIPNQYIVRFRDTESNVNARGKEIEGLYGAKVQREYVAAIKGVLVNLADQKASAVAADPNVIAIEQDQTVSLTATQTGATWGLDRIDQRLLPLSTTYSYTPDGTGVTVYIIDTGINFTHNEYNGRAFFGTDVGPNGSNTAGVDCNGHGSHVSGTVGGTTYGVAKNVTLVAVRVLDCGGSGTFGGVIAGIDWVRLNRHLPAVANMSLGGAFSSTVNAAVTNAINAGVVFAVAAGNSSGSACNESPSSTPLALTIGATTITDGFASFSNFGNCVDLNAPGVGITSAWIGSNSATNTISGTSMATPHVAGAAALYLQTNPGAMPGQVAAALVGNATPNVISGVPSGTPNLLLYTGFVSPPPLPVANFTSSCPSLTCNFDASSSTTAWPSATYTWTFGDATTGSGKTTSHSYSVAGTYAVTLTVTDPNGTNSKTSNVTTGTSTNLPPVAAISSPANNGSFAQGTSVSFAGTGTDPEQGALTGASLTWTSNINGAIGTGTSFSKNNLSVGTHTITLTATDAQGATGTATVTITITAATNQPPVAAISLPANNSSFVQGTSVSFAGTGTDPETGALIGDKLQWKSSIDGSIGHGASFTKSTLSLGTHTITLTATDPLGATGTATVTITITSTVANQPPVAAISSPANNGSFVQGTSVSFAGTGTDPEQGTLTGAALTWKSNIDGAIGTGTSFSKSNLSVGTHTITLTATDNQGATGTATVTITIVANQPPVAAISSPANNSSFVQGTSVSFAGTGTDPEQGTLTGAALTWTSSIDGAIGTGISFSKNNLSVGTHTITLTATDNQGAKGTATVTVSITAPNQPPVAAISSPANNGSFVQGTSVSFAGTGTDPEQGALTGAALTWTSNINGAIGTGTSFSKSNLSVGTHTITLTATDNQGATGTATVTITIVANQPPTAAISSPANNSSAVQGTSVSFAGTGTDPEQGALTGASLTWTSNIDGAIGTGTSFSKSNLSVGTHTITLTATDAQGATGTATVTVSITAPNQPPTAAISSPTNNGSFLQGTSVSFAGTGTDPEQGALTGAALTWTSNIDGAIGTGTSFSKSNLSVGTHTITLTATDNQGAKGTATVTISITAPNQPPVAAISSPTNNGSFVQGTSVSFAGTGTDPEQGALTGASLTWTSNINGAIGTGTSFSKSNLSVGTHTITLTATDNQGATGTATVTITIVANQPPTAAISSPGNNSSFVQGTSVSFAGTGTDPEQGALTGAALTWTSNIDGAIGTGTSFSKSNLSVGTHTITLTATDNQGAKGTATVTVVITASTNQPPVATITLPANNSTFPQGTLIKFTGTGVDPEQGPLIGDRYLKWTSSINGPIGNGGLFNKSTLSVGTHIITLTAIDAQGATGTATITIVITP